MPLGLKLLKKHCNGSPMPRHKSRHGKVQTKRNHVDYLYDMHEQKEMQVEQADYRPTAIAIPQLAEAIAACIDTNKKHTEAAAVNKIVDAKNRFPFAAAMLSVPYSDSNPYDIQTIANVALGSDCLRIVAVVSPELQPQHPRHRRVAIVAYMIAKPIAAYYASVFGSYETFSELDLENVGPFLAKFSNDDDWFGGTPRSEGFRVGATLALIASVIERNQRILDAYHDLTECILKTIFGSSLSVRFAVYADMFRNTREEYEGYFRNAVAISDNMSKLTTPDASRDQAVSPTRIGDISGITAVGAKDGPNTRLEGSVSVEQERAVAEATSALNALIGIPGAKNQVTALVNFLAIQRERQRYGLRSSTQSLHFVFTGNPGTGKTTVARILGKMFYGFGILKTPKMIECDRTTLVGGFLGQTAIKTDDVIRSAMDGVLFIDEAYSLAGDAERFGHGDMYGGEAINTLLKRMEDHRDRLIVIAAGYPKEMKNFVGSNPGLESRFTRFIHFDDYTVPELCQIFEKFCNDSEYILSPAGRAYGFILFSMAYAQRTERFGNARFVRNVLEQALSKHSRRLVASGAAGIDESSLKTIKGLDIPLEMISGLNYSNIHFTDSRWEAQCPGCGTVSKATMKLLGMPVTCKCGETFVMPWWNLLPETVPDLPLEISSMPSTLSPQSSDPQAQFAVVDQLIQELDQRFVGMSEVKSQFITIVNDVQLQAELGGQAPKAPRMVFLGNPGTGKTSAARELARLLRAVGAVVSNGWVETRGAELKGSWLGQTKDKVIKAISDARGGVLFIDEAYSLANDKYGMDSYAMEAIDALVGQTELPENAQAAVILAGYLEPMQRFMETNPGLSRRFPTAVVFPDYSTEECVEILRRWFETTQSGQTLPLESSVVSETLVAAILQRRSKGNFGNAGDMEALGSRIVSARNSRLRTVDPAERREQSRPRVEDVIQGVEQWLTKMIL
jgi:SpoVK/Ycf46/Vps4 family AAA+-type ATPase